MKLDSLTTQVVRATEMVAKAKLKVATVSLAVAVEVQLWFL
jgi:hypothetical protein